MSYTVGIVGATGAVGKEIKDCLEKRNFPVSQLRIFGSARSAGTTVQTEKYGSVTVELFDRAAARECDVVFLAVSGDFALEHAKALVEGDDGCVVIDNSVRLCVCVAVRVDVSDSFPFSFTFYYLNSPHFATRKTFPWSFRKSTAPKPKSAN